MKLVTLSIIAAVGAILFGSASVAEAGPRYSYSGGYYNSGYGGHSQGSYRHARNHYPAHRYDGDNGYCAQPYKVSTVEVNRYTQCRTAYDHYGRPYTYHVTVVTYCDHYSNGTTRTWSKTFS